MAKKRTHRTTPMDWQRDPDYLVTESVQYWRRGVMMIANMSRDRARRLVRDGLAFVISGQAIGALTEDGQYNG